MRIDINKDDITALHNAVEVALLQDHVVVHQGHAMGGDEVLYGRAGLLWAVLNLQQHAFDENTSTALDPVFGAVPKLVAAIIDSGILGAQQYVKLHGGTNAMPLMWPWFDEYYGVGA